MNAPEKKPDGGSAHPMHFQDDIGGMTKRERYALAAMQGLLANSGGPIQANHASGWIYTNCEPGDVARESVALADALIAELAK